MRLPVSVKGVVLDGGRTVLLNNERGGGGASSGRLEAGEEFRECLEREVREELNIRVEAGPLLDAYVYEVVEGKHVLIVVYGCFVEDISGMRRSYEHSEAGKFDVGGLDALNFHVRYGGAVRIWLEHHGRET